MPAVQGPRPWRVWAAPGLALFLVVSPAAAAERCEAQLAATFDFRDGAPADAIPTPDGTGALFLRSGPRDTEQALWRYDAGGGARLLLAPATLLGGATETLSTAEKARRERARVATRGFADVALTQDGRSALVSLDGRLWLVDARTGAARGLPGEGWIAPLLSPDGRSVAAMRGNDVHVIDVASGADRAITSGGTDLVTHGVGEFAAAEELDRPEGSWWSPDGRFVVVETVDNRGVEPHLIADPGHPSLPGVAVRYPRAGTSNAETSFAIVPVAGGAGVPIAWDRGAFPYVARVVWQAGAPLSLVVLDRDQWHERVLTVDAATGATRTLLDETDAAWINVTPFAMGRGERALPYWLPGGRAFLWASELSGDWRLELHGADGRFERVLTPDGFRYSALLDVDPAHHGGELVVRGGTDPLAEAVFRIGLAGGAPVPLAAARGLHHARFGQGHATFVDDEALADGRVASVLRGADGTARGALPSVAEAPALPPRIAFTTAGKRGLDAAVVRPHGWHKGERLPVVLAVYAGPGFKTVRASGRLFAADQCLADHGAIVVSIDGRGTPGHGRDFERAIKGDLIDDALADQVDGLRALGARYPEMDMRRVAVSGWSFGGYMAAMATMRRPDVFASGIAGAPPVDWQDYDTAYTERYLGQPSENASGYHVSNVLTYAGGLTRPLLIIHGFSDDNVYFVNSVKLTDALLRAGRPYELLLLPGTHMLVDPALRLAVTRAMLGFLRRTIGLGG